MTLHRLLREVIDSGRLQEPFNAAEATWAVDRQDWPVHRVHSFLVRYCRGNLAARRLLFERASFGRYRLIAGSMPDRIVCRSSARRRWSIRKRAEEPDVSPESKR